MILTDFWLLIDAAIAGIVQVFTITDMVVIVDSPRFTIMSLMTSIIFLVLMVKLLTWFAGHVAHPIFNKIRGERINIENRLESFKLRQMDRVGLEYRPYAPERTEIVKQYNIGFQKYPSPDRVKTVYEKQYRPLKSEYKPTSLDKMRMWREK